MNNYDLVLFDGVCNFCNGSINLVIDNDPNAKFKFVPLQSNLGQELIQKHKLDKVDTIILISQDKAFIKSTAALKIAKRMKGFWPVFYIFMVVPAFIRDLFYDIIAKNRYKLFGKSDACRIPTEDLKSRFLS